ncbi:hypothetical protein [Geminocystis sp. GBBB08]|uniref:hypothetical protein n=1 Tax=Geminocystis sp. GBBB08 TaxID=2604140 RepID=UPI0027E2297E|nr:hypothetical protein [Geminocystis sp. GBBB08]MBL1208658.1 hypothetical protein [Geminocystis sp. GBBB08]
MSKSIKKLRDDLIVLNTKIQNLATNLLSLYQDYFQNFSEIVNRQLILAVYQICTQKYPDSFLRLSYQQRINLQKQIKALDTIFIENLLDSFKSIELPNNKFIQDFYNQIITLFSSLLITENSPQETLLDSKNTQTNNSENLSTSQEINPEELIKFQLDIEDCIEECLMNISHRTNKYLQNANILPNKIPSKILEMALQAEENTSLVSGSPNLLSLVIEKEDTSDNLNISPIIALCLRLTEIEFNHTQLNLIRQKITILLQELDALENEYTKINQQYAIAQAESAWRSSWNE